jgi:hypothetical protein
MVKKYVLYRVIKTDNYKIVAQDILEVTGIMNEDMSMEVYDRVKAIYPNVFTKNNEDNLSVIFSNFTGKEQFFA